MMRELCPLTRFFRRLVRPVRASKRSPGPEARKCRAMVLKWLETRALPHDTLGGFFLSAWVVLPSDPLLGGGSTTVQGSAQVMDGAPTGSSAPGNPPAPANPPPVKGSIQVKIPRYPSPGLNPVQLHLNDNFDKEQVSATDNTRFISDDKATDINANGDPELKSAQLTVGPPGTVGKLTWTYDNTHIRIWWQQGGKWVQVANDNNFTAPNQAITLLLEGTTGLSTGTVSYTFTPKNGTPGSNSFKYRVYTGLQVMGIAPATKFVSELSASADYGLSSDANGNVRRTDAAQKPKPGWKSTFRDFLDQVFANADFHHAVTGITTFNAVADASVEFANCESGRFDPDDIDAVLTQDKQVGSAILIHEVWELYQKQIKGLKCAINPPQNEQAGGDAHSEGINAENAVMGARRDEALQDFQNADRVRQIYYHKLSWGQGDIVLKYEYHKTDNQSPIQQVKVTRT